MEISVSDSSCLILGTQQFTQVRNPNAMAFLCSQREGRETSSEDIQSVQHPILAIPAWWVTLGDVNVGPLLSVQPDNG